MANYLCSVRTNYFHVKDEDKFREMMSQVYGCEDSVDLWQETDNEGKTVFGFGCYGGISGVINAKEDENEDVDETAFDEFISGLQKCVADDDAIIIELKAGATAEQAIEQIKDRQYALRFAGKIGEKPEYTGRILAVGIAYAKGDTGKKHSCRVEVLRERL